MNWERLVTLEGGAVGAIACAGTQATTAFAATLAGVFRSTNGGDSWEWTSQGLISPFVQDVAVSPDFERDGIVAAATAVSGLHMSYDRGESWFRLDFWGVRPTVTRVAFSPDFGRDQTLVAGTQYEGVYVSRNRGKSWSGFADGLESAEITALAVAPGVADGGPILAALDSGSLLASTDVGRSWQRVERSEADPIESCAWIDRDSAIAGTASGRLLRSTDGGRNWDQVWRADDDTVNGLAVRRGDDGGRLIVAVTGAGRLLESHDAGNTWREQPLRPEGGVSALSVAVFAGGVLVGTDRNGVYRRIGGESAVPANTGLVNRPILDLAASPAFAADGTLLLGTLKDGVLVSRDGGATWEPGAGDFSMAPVTAVRLSPDFANDGTAGVIAGGDVVWSVDGARSWKRLVGLAADGAASLLEFSPEFAKDGHVVVGGAGSPPQISQDRGRSWRSLGTGLPGGDLLALGFSPQFGRDRAMVAAVGDAARFVVAQSKDAGESWRPWVEYEAPTGWASLALPTTFKADRGPLLLAFRDRIAMPHESGRGPWTGLRLGEGVAIRQVTTSPTFEHDGFAAAAASDGVYLSNTHGHIWSRMDGPLAGEAVERVSIWQADDRRRTIHAALSRGELWQFTA